MQPCVVEPRQQYKSQVFQLVSALKECSASKDIQTGRAIHSRAVTCGIHTNVYLSTTLINMYAKCGCMVEARRVFDRMRGPNVEAWTAMMLGYVEVDEPDLALGLFQHLSCPPDDRVFVAAFKAVAALARHEQGTRIDGKLVKLESLEKGMAVHSQSARSDYAGGVFMNNSLIYMYSKCGSTSDSQRVLRRMQMRDVVSWNTLILGHAENGEGELGVEAFCAMQREDGLLPNTRSFVAVLKSCSVMGERDSTLGLERLMAVHRYSTELNCHSSLHVGNSLIDLYARYGGMVDSHRVFQAMPNRNIVSWNSLILGYAQDGQGDGALEMYAAMEAEESPNAASLFALLKACGNDLHSLKAVHGEVHRRGFESSGGLTNCLIDLYGRCGDMVYAELLFESLEQGSKDVSIWTALLTGYCRQGDTETVLGLFQRMKEEQLGGDRVTFICILNACSQAGLVEEGKRYFREMESVYGIQPDLDHFHCLLDLLGRANRLTEAMEIVRDMPVKPNAITWKTVLAACRNT